MSKYGSRFFQHQTKVIGFTPPPNRIEVKQLIEKELKPFAEKFSIDIQLCLPDEAPAKPKITLDTFA